jgi:hypothetical protein
MNANLAIKRVFDEWHRATVARDVDALALLYAEDAVFESPTITLTLGQSTGIVRGRPAIRALIENFFIKVTASTNEWYRTGAYFSDGHQLIWEYPRKTLNGEQADILEVMEITDGLITYHKVYWGWRGLQALLAARG